MAHFYEQLDHTGDCAIAVWADSPAQLYANAAAAMMDLLIGLSRIGGGLTRTLHLRASDRDALLVAWLDELLFLFETEGLIFRQFTIDSLSEQALTATVDGEAYRPSEHQYQVAIKAVTYHQLQITEQHGAWRTRVIFDL